ncbi:hypothetical protein IWQ62_001087 [Dispira parvispora]|uniref:BAR-domain-containing protein n=1 Tax=Dispira parvispora TaxID=1520584 RepID=A0A9W8AT91_9FUNG|nr:hypothetical protein IWQ62_001087 [Dispira parvispora]
MAFTNVCLFNKLYHTQWTGEKVGLSQKTKESEEFQTLQEITDKKKSSVDGLEVSVLRFIDHGEKKKESTDGSKTKVTAVENLGLNMIAYGGTLGERSLYGQTLVKLGEVQEEISRATDEFINDIKDPFSRNINDMKRQLDEYSHLKKKLKSRRLEYDAMASKQRGNKKEKRDVGDEAYTAQVRYEDTYDSILERMMQLEDDEDMYIEDLAGFFRAQMSYHRKALDALESIAEWVESSSTMKRKSARERFDIEVPVRERQEPQYDAGSIGRGSLRRQGTINTNDGNDNASDYDSRTQYSADDRTDMYNYAHGIDDADDARSQRRNSVGRSGWSAKPSHHTYDDEDRYPSEANGKSAAAAVPPPRPPRQTQPKLKQRKAVYDYEPSASDELAFVEDDIITVVDEMEGEGWWVGEVVDRTTGEVRKGMFPVNYTEEYTGPPPPYEPPVEEEPPAPTLPSRASTFVSDHVKSSPSLSPSTTTSSSSPHGFGGQLGGAVAAAASSRAPMVRKPVSISAAGHRAPPPPPPSSGGVSRVHSMASSRPTGFKPPRAGSTVEKSSAVGACSTCGCDEFSPNVFRKNNCNNCFHPH